MRSGVAAAPSADRASFSLARFPSGASRMISTPRCDQMSGNRSNSSGRADASTMHGRSASAASAESRNAIVGRSPQCRSSRTITTGPRSHDATRKSRNAELVWSAMRRCRRRRRRPRAEADARAGDERRARELAQELRHVRRERLLDARGDGGGDLVAPRVHRRAVDDAGRAPHELREHAERRSRARRVAARDPHRRRLGPVAEAAQELVADARLADARGAREHDGPRARLARALVVVGRQGGELALAADARRLAPEERARGAGERLRARPARGGGRGGAVAGERLGGALAHEHVAFAFALAVDLEARAEEAGGHLVDADRRRVARQRVGHGLALQRERAIEERADGERGAIVAEARGDGDRRVRQHGAEGERRARGAEGEIGRGAAALERRDDGAVGERLGRRAVRHERAPHEIERRTLRLDELGPVRRVPRRAREQDAEQPLLEAGQRRRPAAGLARAVDGRRDRAEVVDLRRERGAVGRARRRVLRQHALDEIVDTPIEPRHERREARRRLEHDPHEHRQEILGLERRPPREHDEQQHRERVDVGRRIDIGEPARLLRRHVVRRADHDAGRGERELPAGARDAEVDDLGLREVAVDEEDVRRLDVAVHDADRVREAEALGDAADERDGLRRGELAALQAGGEILALEPLHREVGPAVVVAVRDVADDRVVPQRREEPRLTQEARGVALAGVRAEELDRDEAARRAVARAVHLAHGAAAREGLELEAIVEDAHASSPRRSREPAKHLAPLALDAAVVRRDAGLAEVAELGHDGPREHEELGRGRAGRGRGAPSPRARRASPSRAAARGRCASPKAPAQAAREAQSSAAGRPARAARQASTTTRAFRSRARPSSTRSARRRVLRLRLRPRRLHRSARG